MPYVCSFASQAIKRLLWYTWQIDTPESYGFGVFFSDGLLGKPSIHACLNNRKYDIIKVGEIL